MCYKKLIIGQKGNVNYDVEFEKYWKLTKTPEEINTYYISAVSRLENYFCSLKRAIGPQKYKDILNKHDLNYNVGHQKNYPTKKIMEYAAFWVATNFGLPSNLQYEKLELIDDSFVDFKYISKLSRAKNINEYSQEVENMEKLVKELGTSLKNICDGADFDFDKIPEKYRQSKNKCNCFLFRPFVVLLILFLGAYALFYYFLSYPLIYFGLFLCGIGLSDYLYSRVSRWLLLFVSCFGLMISCWVYFSTSLWESFVSFTNPMVGFLSWSSFLYVLLSRLYVLYRK